MFNRFSAGSVRPTGGAGGTSPRRSRARCRLTSIALAVASAVSLTAAVAPQAQAAWLDCRDARMCLFDGTNGGRPYASFAIGSPDLGAYRPYFNNRTSSYWNRTGSRWCLYRDRGYGGGYLVVEPGNSYYTNSLSSYWNNTISSLRKC